MNKNNDGRTVAWGIGKVTSAPQSWQYVWVKEK